MNYKKLFIVVGGASLVGFAPLASAQVPEKVAGAVVAAQGSAAVVAGSKASAAAAQAAAAGSKAAAGAVKAAGAAAKTAGAAAKAATTTTHAAAGAKAGLKVPTAGKLYVTPQIKPVNLQPSTDIASSLSEAVTNAMKKGPGTSARVQQLMQNGAVLSGPEVQQLLAKDMRHVLFRPQATYEKFARIQAVQAQGGEPIETVLANGTRETTNVAKKGDWIVTNPGGEQYIVPGDKFPKKYEAAPELGEGWFKPAGGPQQFVKIHQDMTITAPWGEQQVLKKGAYLNVTNPNDIYGVAEAEFHDTYNMVTLNSADLQDMLLSNDFASLFGPAHMYTKTARIQAVQAQGGEPIETVLADGTRETTNVAKKGDWIVTNPGGEQYIVPGDKFPKKYEAAPELGEGWFKPTGGPQRFVQINENMNVMASWGEKQVLKKGAYLNITNPGDIYGVAEAEFNTTYGLVK